MCNLLSGNDFEEDGKHGKGGIIIVGDFIRLGDADAEDAQENVPQVEAELVLHVSKDIGSTFVLVGVGVWEIHAERPFLIGVGRADSDGDWEDGDIHHDQQAELYRGIHIGEVERRGSGVS